MTDADTASVDYTGIAVREVLWSLPFAACDRCHLPAGRVWDAERCAIDIDLDHPVLLLVRVSVHRCAPCRHYFWAQPPFLRPDAVYANRVVQKALDSVYADGMAMLRVTERLKRDFWVQPSEASIRLWCQTHVAGLTLEGDYRDWVVSQFSGVLCVDEVYQGKLALLLAVDPAAPTGDRLVGYQLVKGDVEQEQVEGFLRRLQRAGIEPEEIITDRSALYPTVLGKVWPQAVHQLCLFHETRAVTRAVLDVVREVRRELPQEPPTKRLGGRLRKAPTGEAENDSVASRDRESCIALVRRLRAEGLSEREIARQTGHSRNTIKAWRAELAVEPPLDEEKEAWSGIRAGREAAQADQNGDQGAASVAEPVVDEVEPGQPGGVVHDAGKKTILLANPQGGESKVPPSPWRSWEEVKYFSGILLKDRFLLVHRPENLTEEEQKRLEKLLDYAAAQKLRLARQFLEEWYAIWRDEQGAKRSLEDASLRYVAWHENQGYQGIRSLKEVLSKVDEGRFRELSHHLSKPEWEATNNGAERMGREFRHQQASHFALRTTTVIEGVIKMRALQGQAESSGQEGPVASRSQRGRKGRSLQAAIGTEALAVA